MGSFNGVFSSSIKFFMIELASTRDTLNDGATQCKKIWTWWDFNMVWPVIYKSTSIVMWLGTFDKIMARLQWVN